MSKSVRTHIPDGFDATSRKGMKHLSKLEFGKRVWKLMTAKGWRQADLARQANIPADSISDYINGRVMPTSIYLKRLADAFNTTPEELLPNTVESAIEEEHPSIEMKVIPGAPTQSWLRINRLVSTSVAAKVIQLITEDDEALQTK